MLGATGEAPLKAIVLLNVEPALDAANGAAAVAACHSAEMVVVLSPFKDAGADVADVMLPIAPFTETSGTFVNAEGRVQSVHGVVKPLGDTRPAWKVLRVLGNLLGLEGFTFETPEEVRDEALGSVDAIPGRLNNRPAQTAADAGQGSGDRRPAALERIADVPIYATDSIVRRAPSLQLTADARRRSRTCRATCGSASASRPATRSGFRRAAPRRCCRRRSTRPWPRPRCASRPGIARPPALGAMFGPIAVEKAPLRCRHRSTSVRRPLRSAAARPEGRSDVRIRQHVRIVPARRLLADDLEPRQDPRARRAADAVRRLPDAVGAQGDRLEPDPPRPEPRRPARPAAADRRRGEAAVQGDHRPDRGQPRPVLPRPGHDDHAGARGLGGGAVRSERRALEHQRRPAVRDGDHLDGGLRRDHRRLGLELEVRLPRRAARVGADGELRDRDGLRARRRADGLGQPEPDRHRAGPGRRASSPTAASPSCPGTGCRCCRSSAST